ncbi:MAG: TetR/AcrR family transcriptional regulator [Oscillospiraceae bacterium]|jgi:AcrR family transcriptional regulator
MVKSELILKTIISLMETTPYNQIKVSRITEEAGISRSTFYFYFKTVQDAVDELEDNFIQGIYDEADAVSRIRNYTFNHKSFSEMLTPTIHYVGTHLHEFRVLSGPNGDPAFHEKLTERMRNMYYALYTTVFEKTSVESELSIAMLASIQWGIYCCWAENSDRISEADVTAYLSKVLVLLDESGFLNQNN